MLVKKCLHAFPSTPASPLSSLESVVEHHRQDLLLVGVAEIVFAFGNPPQIAQWYTASQGKGGFGSGLSPYLITQVR